MGAGGTPRSSVARLGGPKPRPFPPERADPHAPALGFGRAARSTRFARPAGLAPALGTRPAITRYPGMPQPPSPVSRPTDRELALRRGEGLAFVVAPMRGGTTLLRKVLDSHPDLYSPAETWFLLPLLTMWAGGGSAGAYSPAQAAAAIKSHIDSASFLEAARAFAGAFYDRAMPPGPRVFVDKTPPYIDVADTLPAVFPGARFIVLTRDPRGTLWSRISWKHTPDEPLEQTVRGVARHARIQAAFLRAHADRTLRVAYEDLCRDPEPTAAALCRFLGVEPRPGMTDYGAVPHHEGYGDEKSREHRRPHTDSVRRWEGNVGEPAQADLARLITPADLETLGYPELADAAAVA